MSASGDQADGNLVEDAIAFAVQAHKGQTDKGGAPYILHILRVMHRVRSPMEMVVAALHDVVEDTPYTLDDLRAAGYPDQAIESVDCLTRRDGETYRIFIERVTTNPVARIVKIADVPIGPLWGKDNLSPERAHNTSPSLKARYQRALAHLTSENEHRDIPP